MNPFKTTKIIFFSTSDRSLPILESVKDNFNLIFCVTKKNSKIGRYQIEKETEVKRWCKKNKVDFIEVSCLKGEDLEYLSQRIKKADPDYGIVADFGFIIPQQVIESIKGGIINVHFSLLPKYRGASPVQNAILNGDKKTGVTFYLLDKNMDTGDIITQIEYKIDSKYTSDELYKILFQISAEKLPEIIKKYSEGKIIPIKQDENLATYTISKTNPKSTLISREDALIDWNENPEKIERAIRAFYPWPIAWTYLRDMEKAEIFPEKVELKDHINKNLRVKIFKSHLDDGKLKIDEIQVEGKNKMNWESFKNGYLKKTN
ncbi:MAG TPA: methionyl-tRNA formyltransferase [bacterium]|jgi:methionyl-tRNA formyltransferase|nr:methionyl-tRNA formyltransferase [bacterium]